MNRTGWRHLCWWILTSTLGPKTHTVCIILLRNSLTLYATNQWISVMEKSNILVKSGPEPFFPRLNHVDHTNIWRLTIHPKSVGYLDITADISGDEELNTLRALVFPFEIENVTKLTNTCGKLTWLLHYFQHLELTSSGWIGRVRLHTPLHLTE